MAVFIFSLILDGLMAYVIKSISGHGGFFYWFIILQIISFCRLGIAGVFSWWRWRSHREETVRKYHADFVAIGFPSPSEDEVGEMLFLERVAGSPHCASKVKELAHQIIVIVRTLNDFRMTTERERYLDAVGEALVRLQPTGTPISNAL